MIYTETDKLYNSCNHKKLNFLFVSLLIFNIFDLRKFSYKFRKFFDFQ